MVEDVTFAQLRTFACAARVGSFVQAADKLEISQPVVSEQIKALEDRIGQPLFRRRRGTTPVLTAEGEDALETVMIILAAHDRLMERGRASPGKVMLRISAGPFLRDNYLRALIPRIYREYPDIEIDLQPTTNAGEVMRQIASGALDLAIYAIPVEEAAPPQSRMICELPLVLVAAPGTRARLAAGLCALDDFQFIFPWRRDLGARWAKTFLRDLKLAPRIPPYFTEFVDAIPPMVEGGQGIGHLMAHSIADRIAAGRLEILDVPLSPMRRFIARSPHAPEVAKAIEEMLCEALVA